MVKIKIIDVNEVIKPKNIYYNESLREIEYGEPPFSYWPVGENRLRYVEEMRYKRLSDILRD
ncbi:MAG: hypothetical protein AABW81_00265 [Nanoarchaeota archaeon]